MFPISDADVRRSATPIVNIALIALNALVFLYEIQLGGFAALSGSDDLDITRFFYSWGFIPNELSSGEAYDVLRIGFGQTAGIETPAPTWVTIFSSMFIHGGLAHFGGNMIFLWVFGNNIEDRMGHIPYLLFYLVTGVAATLSHFAIDPGSQTPLVGASGAISGVMGAYLLLYPYNRIRALVIFFLITMIELPAMLLLGIWFLLQLFNALGTLGVSDQVSVAFFAHVGGFVAGMVIIAAYKILTNQPIWPPRRRDPWDFWYRTRRWRE